MDPITEQTEYASIKINQIHPNPGQPRKMFNRKKLEEPAGSIKENGLMEPIVVTKRHNGYMIVAGERRYGDMANPR